MHEQFAREMPEKVDKGRTWQWLPKSDLKIRTEAVLYAAQEHAIRRHDNVAKKVNLDLCEKNG